jgi:hypothetical protein
MSTRTWQAPCTFASVASSGSTLTFVSSTAPSPNLIVRRAGFPAIALKFAECTIERCSAIALFAVGEIAASGGLLGTPWAGAIVVHSMVMITQEFFIRLCPLHHNKRNCRRYDLHRIAARV